MATKRRSSTKPKRRSTKPRRKSGALVRASTPVGALRIGNRSKGRRKARTNNPKRSRSRRRRASNPVGGGVATEALYYTVAGFGVNFATPFVNRLIGGFLPLGQFTQPAVFAITGFTVAWLAGITAFTRRFQRPAAVMGVALAFNAILTPWVRKFLNNASLQSGWGMSGPSYSYRRNMRGAAVVTGIPPNILPPPPPVPAPANGSMMQGVAAWPRQW